jgi:adenylate kinase family enzyme
MSLVSNRAIYTGSDGVEAVAMGRDVEVTGSSPARTVVFVTGIPGAGKTTMSRALSRALTLPLLSKDAVKESLFDVLGVRDREWSLQLGAAANNVLWAVLADCSAGAVVDMWLDPIRDAGIAQQGLAQAHVETAYEIICDCPAELAVQRYTGRVRHPGHLPPDQATLQRIHDSSVLMTPLGIGPTKHIDTTGPVDIPELVRWLRGGNDG